MKVYRHTPFGKMVVIAFKSAGVLAALIGTLMMIPFVIGQIRDGMVYPVFCYVIAFTLIGWAVALIFFNFYPEVIVDEQGIQISFMFSWARILWQDVIDCGVGHPPIGATLVRARKVTPIHILYGWMFSYSFFPAFLIGRTIDDRDDLLKQINHHLLVRRSIH